jgi:hypothetical protein
MMIVDEAHNCAPSGRGRYATDSLRTQALRLLVPHFEHKLFLTATPHNGYPESFSALLELLDNQRFARSTTPDRKQLNAVMVRRMKSELPPKWDGSPRFPKRMLLVVAQGQRFLQHPRGSRPARSSCRKCRPGAVAATMAGIPTTRDHWRSPQSNGGSSAYDGSRWSSASCDD